MFLPSILLVRDFTMQETILMGIVVGIGVSFVTWLLAGYYERRGGMGKK